MHVIRNIHQLRIDPYLLFIAINLKVNILRDSQLVRNRRHLLRVVFESHSDFAFLVDRLNYSSCYLEIHRRVLLRLLGLLRDKVALICYLHFNIYLVLSLEGINHIDEDDIQRVSAYLGLDPRINDKSLTFGVVVYKIWKFHRVLKKHE